MKKELTLEDFTKEDIYIFKYSFDRNAGIRKQKLHLEYRGNTITGNKIYRYNSNKSTVFSDKLNIFNGFSLYLTEERDIEVKDYFEAKFKKVIEKAHKDIQTANDNLRFIKIIEWGD